MFGRESQEERTAGAKGVVSKLEVCLAHQSN